MSGLMAAVFNQLNDPNSTYSYGAYVDFPNSNTHFIKPRGDIPISMKLVTTERLTSLTCWSINLPFKEIESLIYICEPVYNISRHDIVANVPIVLCSILWIYGNSEKTRSWCIELFSPFVVCPIHIDLQQLYAVLNIPFPQVKSSNFNAVKQVLDDTKFLPADVTSIIAEYHSDYKSDYKIVNVELKQGEQFYNPSCKLKVVGFKYKKDANLRIIMQSIDILPANGSILSHELDNHIIKTVCPCDISFTGYNPEKDNVRYVLFFPSSEIVMTVDIPTTVQLICL